MKPLKFPSDDGQKHKCGTCMAWNSTLRHTNPTLSGSLTETKASDDL